MTRRRAPDAGLTLVEVLVVLAILAAASGAVVLGLGGADRGARAEAEARRLADRLRTAADAALVDGAPRALAWDAEGYRFRAWDPAAAAWRDESQPALGPHALAAGVTLDGGDADPAPLLIAPDAARPPAALRLRGGAGESWTVAFDGLGATAARGGP